ncbi:MAG: ATP-binding protein [Muribaculaceae bacterium]|nr:ATP-binding protein [Bacteroides sp.]MDE6222873.1 ATP-binding protein [Muribaculaceae bacterium]MBD5328193.1 ATP-binding protein [Bacteroides sp.]MBD5414815.1 ATP-binding protein [Bacteroides sp.]MBD5424793.1 ATP-binding protein [Bacteroides sp.]
MPNLYDIRRRGTLAFMLATVAVVAAFLWVSDRLVNDLSAQERARMQIWADATREIASADSSTNLDFLLSIIKGNSTIPVILVDDSDNILDHLNFNLPENNDTLPPWELTAENERFLREHLASLKKSENVITIVIAPGINQHLYYEDSLLLRRLSWYPYVQLAVMAGFIFVVYYAVSATKRAEQNKVWVGLSKETAHQLGTPISSLMAWVEILPGYGVDSDVVAEMNKDVNRLNVIASRFSKIGSPPVMVAADLNSVVEHAVDYMRTRISSGVRLTLTTSAEPLRVELSTDLLAWVLENLIKNAVDAMEGHGSIEITTFVDGSDAVVEVTDTGKGIARKDFKTIFNPGYTTKKRGWGLGLTLAKRIVDDYHHGHIFVKASEPNRATTFRLQFPLA